MSLLVGLQFRDQLKPVLADDLDQLIAAVQNGLTTRTQGGSTTGLLLGLQNPEQLPPVVRDELDQVIAAIQTAFNSQTLARIKSVHRGTINIIAGASTATTVISGVNGAYCTVGHAGQRGGGVNAAEHQVRLSHTNGTNSLTITASRGYGTTGSPTISYEVTEYDPSVVRSCQEVVASYTAPSTSASATLTTTLTNLQNVLLVYQGWCVTADGGTVATDEGSGSTVALSASGITLTRNVTDGNVQQGYALVEFN